MDKFWQGFDKQAGLFSVLKRGLQSAPAAKAAKVPSIAKVEKVLPTKMGNTRLQRNVTFKDVAHRASRYADI